MYYATLVLIRSISIYSDNALLNIVFVDVKVVCVFDAYCHDWGAQGKPIRLLRFFP